MRLQFSCVNHDFPTGALNTFAVQVWHLFIRHAALIAITTSTKTNALANQRGSMYVQAVLGSDCLT